MRFMKKVWWRDSPASRFRKPKFGGFLRRFKNLIGTATFRHRFTTPRRDAPSKPFLRTVIIWLVRNCGTQTFVVISNRHSKQFGANRRKNPAACSIARAECFALAARGGNHLVPGIRHDDARSRSWRIVLVACFLWAFSGILSAVASACQSGNPALSNRVLDLDSRVPKRLV